jgi:hypothetical protein
MEMLARRYANGSFAGDPVSILIPGQDNWLYRWTGAFDGLGNFRMVFSLNDRVLTSEYKIDQGIWTAPAVLWDGAVNGSSVAVNSRGDAIVVWTAYAERTPGTPDKGKNISLMTRRFTR